MNTIDGFIFDLDGTIYLGETALPDAVNTILGLRRLGKATLFVSNKPLEPRAIYAAKLTQLGMLTDPEDVITSAYVLAHHLARYAPHLRFYVLGEANLVDELRGHDLYVVDELTDQSSLSVIDPAGIDAVVVAFDRTLDYRKLNTAYQALRRGARYFATNADKTCPMPGGDVPDAGATLSALQHLTGRWPELVAGKPSPLILQAALDRLGLPPERCLMVGDRLETDIRMGHDAGMRTAVVLTGVSSRHDAAVASPPPDYIFETLADLWVTLKPT